MKYEYSRCRCRIVYAKKDQPFFLEKMRTKEYVRFMKIYEDL